MGYFDEELSVNEYIKMSEGFDGREIIEKIRGYLPQSSSVLELGMGPGRDMDILAKNYQVTGSDSSQIFLDLYRKNHPEADLLKLDAVTIETDKYFDCIYSNKVLQHIKREDLPKSFIRQLSIIKKDGIAVHTLWLGEKEENYEGMIYNYYQLEELLQLIPDGFEVIKTEIYKEMEEEDSILLILKKK